MPDKLYFDHYLIGEVTAIQYEFPSAFGRFSLVLQPTDDLSRHLLRFYDYSLRYAAFEFNEQDVKDEAMEQQLNDEGDNFKDLIETDKWKLVDDAHNVTPILAPFFDDKGGIVWR